MEPGVPQRQTSGAATCSQSSGSLERGPWRPARAASIARTSIQTSDPSTNSIFFLSDWRQSPKGVRFSAHKAFRRLWEALERSGLAAVGQPGCRGDVALVKSEVGQEHHGLPLCQRQRCTVALDPRQSDEEESADATSSDPWLSYGIPKQGALGTMQERDVSP